MAYKVLFIGAHHEEFEAECPNTIINLAQAGCQVRILNPIGGWNWTFIRGLEGDGRARTIADATAAARALGAEKTIFDFPVAQCDRFSGEIMDQMAEYLADFEPDIIFIHWPKDTHADHRLVARISQHVIRTAPSMLKEYRPDYKLPKEIYAFQTGIAQGYDFFPDLLISCDESTLKIADRAVECFMPTAPDSVPAWRRNFHVKAAYWGQLAGGDYAEAFKFIGPRLPLDGFLLKKILGDKVLPCNLDRFIANSDFN